MGNPVLMATKRERPYQSAMRQRQAEETKHRIVAASRKILKSKGFKVAGAVGVQNYEKAGGTIAHIAKPPPQAADTAKPTSAQ